MPAALITGVLGQDGWFLSELLRSKGYRVVGVDRAAPSPLPAGIEFVEGDVCNRQAMAALVDSIRPSEIYHLAGQSSVGHSFVEPAETFDSIVQGTLNVVEAARLAKERPKVLVACSGEVFGDTGGTAAHEASPYRPASPYGAAKAAAAHLTASYRTGFDCFVCLAYFYNHESPRRPERFVTRKIARAACRIARGLEQRLELGDTSVVRDWGWAPEYVEAAWRMLSLDAPQDFVLATGESVSLGHFVERAFACVGLDAREHVIQSPGLLRRAEIPVMSANPALAAEKLGWRASVRVDEVVERLVKAEQAELDRAGGG